MNAHHCKPACPWQKPVAQYAWSESDLSCLSFCKSVGKINFHLTNRMKFTLFDRYLLPTAPFLSEAFNRFQSQTSASSNAIWQLKPCWRTGFISQSCHTLDKVPEIFLTHLLVRRFSGWLFQHRKMKAGSAFAEKRLELSQAVSVFMGATDTQNRNPEGSF